MTWVIRYDEKDEPVDAVLGGEMRIGATGAIGKNMLALIRQARADREVHWTAKWAEWERDHTWSIRVNAQADRDRWWLEQIEQEQEAATLRGESSLALELLRARVEGKEGG